jgi:hypothetical protein
MIGRMESNYFSNIIQIRDKKTNTLVLKDRCSIQKITSLYSNTKEPIFKLVIDNTPISRNNSYTIKYKCQTCYAEKEITLNLFMRKVNKETNRCEVCKNKDEEKCKKQSEFMKQNVSSILSGNYNKITVKVKENTLEQHLEKSLKDWEDQEEEFKEKYYLYHLTKDDFERIKTKIISINNNKYCDLNEWNYFPTYRIYNQTRFTPMLINKNNNCSEKPLYLKFKCDNCDNEFVHRDLEVIKNHYKLLCQCCSLTNKKFILRKKTLKNGEKIMWQSVPERRFIEWCEDNSISIQNGPKIMYNFKEKQHVYRVDFELPNNKLLIEIKDNHCWHKEQVESGKFQAKELAAKEWCKNNNYTYHVIFPKNLQKLKDSITNNKLL